MARIGFKYFCVAKMKTEPMNAEPTYEAGKQLGKAVSSNLSITNSEGELWADDQIAESMSEFASGTFTAEVDNIALADQAYMYGAKYVDGELQQSSEDNAPYMGVGGVQVILLNNVRKFRAWVLSKVKSKVPDEDNNTKTASVSFGTQPISCTVLQPNYGPWRRMKEFTTEAAAKAYVDTLLNVAAWHAIEVQAQGTGPNKSVDYTGGYAADKSAFELTITGTPTKVYDNGQDVTSSLSGGKYTLASVEDDHKIAVIF